MALTRSEAREKIMIILYQYDLFNSNKIDCDILDILKNNLGEDNNFVENIVNGVIRYKDEIDVLANNYMIDWDIKRIDKTGAAILRLAIYELKYTTTPSAVVINEALELAKKYSDDAVRKMINAVLDKIIN